MRIVIVLDAPTTPLDVTLPREVAKEAVRVARSKTPGGALHVEVVEAYATESLGEDDVAADYARTTLVDEHRVAHAEVDDVVEYDEDFYERFWTWA